MACGSLGEGESMSVIVWSEEVVFLFCCHKSFIVKCLNNGSELVLCLRLNCIWEWCVVVSISQLSVRVHDDYFIAIIARFYKDVREYILSLRPLG